MPRRRKPTIERRQVVQQQVVQEKPELFLQIGVASEASFNHPYDNQDSHLVMTEKNVVGVFDGLGGHADGAWAAQTARDKSQELLNKADTINAGTLARAFRNAHVSIRAKNRGKYLDDQALTTGTIVHIDPLENGEAIVHIALCGDSPVLIIRSNGVVEEVFPRISSNTGHSEEQYKEQLLKTSQSERASLSSLVKTYLHFRHKVELVLGSNPDCSIETASIKILAGDKVVVASDGVTDNLLHSEIADIVLHASNPEEAAFKLRKAAQRRSVENNCLAKIDDTTAIVVARGKHTNTK